LFTSQSTSLDPINQQLPIVTSRSVKSKKDDDLVYKEAFNQSKQAVCRMNMTVTVLCYGKPGPDESSALISVPEDTWATFVN
jgi:hypothetical protein